MRVEAAVSQTQRFHQRLQAGRANIQTGGKMALHIQPTLYSLDGVGGVANPIGLHADRLGVDVHVVLADQSPVVQSAADSGTPPSSQACQAIAAAPASSRCSR